MCIISFFKIDEIYDSTLNDDAIKRFCTLKHNKVPCTACGAAQTNKQCSNKMCKKCCVDKSIRATVQCKCKDHRNAAKKERDVRVEQEILVEGVDFNVPV